MTRVAGLLALILAAMAWESRHRTAEDIERVEVKARAQVAQAWRRVVEGPR